MAHVLDHRTQPARADDGPVAPASPRPLTRREGLVSAAFGAWIIFGLFIDGWAHNHQKPETVVTPWHAILYSGFVVAAWYAVSIARRRRTHEGQSLWEAAPTGHRLVLAGMIVFGFGAVGDMTWHSLFGVEVSLAALLSPTHLLLLTGAILVLSGPFRATWADGRSQAPTLAEFLPALASLALVTALVAFFFQYATPFRRDNYGTWVTAYTTLVTRFSGAGSGYAQNIQIVGLTSLLLTNLLYVAPLVLIVRRWRPPFGSATILFAAVTALVGAIDTYDRPAPLLAAVVAGVLADVLIRALRPSAARPWGSHAMAAATSLTLWATFFAIYQVTYGVGWKPELWAGSIVLAGMSAVAVSALVFPPPLPPPLPVPSSEPAPAPAPAAV
jgi:hypothetical protein